MNNPITLDTPSKYVKSGPPPTGAPSLEWLTTTWSVTHSTLSMWRSARNVRITYKLLPAAEGRPRLDDLVEYEPTKKEGVRKTVSGIDIQGNISPAWNWRGKGLLIAITSHWEILGWGEATTTAGEKERWVVTWFAPTIFTHEGIDVYCDRKEGISEETYAAIREALGKLKEPKLLAMVETHMQPVEIRLPWVEG